MKFLGDVPIGLVQLEELNIHRWSQDFFDFLLPLGLLFIFLCGSFIGTILLPSTIIPPALLY